MFALKRYLQISLCTVSLLTILSCASTSAVKRVNPYKNIDLESTPQELGEASITAKDFWGKNLVLLPSLVGQYPREDLALLEFKHQGNKYEIIFDRDTRNIIFESFLHYEKRYESRDLEVSGKTRDEFGTVYAMVLWGPFMKSGVAYPLVKLGYAFEDKHPYFTLFWPESQNMQSSSYTPGDITNLQPMEFFFTLKQMRTILDIWEAAGLLGVSQSLKQETLVPDEY